MIFLHMKKNISMYAQNCYTIITNNVSKNIHSAKNLTKCHELRDKFLFLCLSESLSAVSPVDDLPNVLDIVGTNIFVLK